MRLHRTTRIACLLAGLGTFLGVASATPPVTDAIRRSVVHTQDDVDTAIDVDYGAYDPVTNSTKTWMSINVVHDDPADDPVQSALLQYGVDSDSSGRLESGEWTTVGTASLTTVGLTTSGNTGVVWLPNGKDGYRVLVDDPATGVYAEAMSDSDVSTMWYYE